MGEKRTPMAWQHRDMNYHQGGYQDKYGNTLEMGQMRQGPPSTSDRLSHRTDKSWRTRGESVNAYNPAASTSYGVSPSRPSYSSGKPASRAHSPDSSSTSSSSSEETDQDAIRSQGPPPPQPIYGYGPYYPGYNPQQPPGYPPSVSQGYPGTLKSTKSVPSHLNSWTWDGEPCPVHHGGPMSSIQGPPSMMPPPPPHAMMPPQMMMGPSGLPPPGHMTLPPKRANSIYDMRVISPAPPIYGTLPIRPPGDRRSLAMTGGPPRGIPSQFLPPMARPRPLVVSEDGTAEPLPVRSPTEKNGGLMPSKMNPEDSKKAICSKGATMLGWSLLGTIIFLIIIGLLLVYIL